MSVFKWLILFAIICGMMWARQLLQREDSIERLPTEELLQSAKIESPDAEESLTYGLHKTIQVSTEPLTTSTGDLELSTDESITLEEIQLLKSRPYSLISTAQQHLLTLSPGHLPTRSTLLRAVSDVRSPNTQKQVSDIFKKEVEWILREAPGLEDSSSLATYIDEFMRLSLFSIQDQDFLNSAIRDISHALSQHPNTMQSLENSIQKHMPWKHPEEVGHHPKGQF